MMTNRTRALDQDKAIEEVLRKAPPRPAPSSLHVESAHKAIRSEWQAVTGRRRVRRRLMALAAAASVIIAVAIGVNVLRVPSALPVQVAMIEKTVGTIYLLREQSQLRETGELTRLVAGQTLVTGRDSGAAIAWSGGGDLRIDEDSRVEFLSTDEILLLAGRVYFDAHSSRPQADTGDGPVAEFVVRTSEGTIAHTGTQYMTEINGSMLTVSVREGRVSIVGKLADAIASAGQRVMLSGSGRPTFTNIGNHGEPWLWVERMAPTMELDQRSAHEFLHWVGRETGLEVSYAGDRTEEIARSTQMIGTVDSEPRDALQILLQTTDLRARIEDGHIVISER